MVDAALTAEMVREMAREEARQILNTELLTRFVRPRGLQETHVRPGTRGNVLFTNDALLAAWGTPLQAGLPDRDSVANDIEAAIDESEAGLPSVFLERAKVLVSGNQTVNAYGRDETDAHIESAIDELRDDVPSWLDMVTALNAVESPLRDLIFNNVEDEADEVASQYWAQPRTAAGSFVTPAGTGTMAVTGLGFKPRVVDFYIGITTSSTANLSLGVGYMTNGSQGAIGIIATNTPAFAHSGVLTNCCLMRITAAGAAVVQAAYSSMDADGFTINFTTTANTSTVLWRAYK